MSDIDGIIGTIATAAEIPVTASYCDAGCCDESCCEGIAEPCC